MPLAQWPGGGGRGASSQMPRAAHCLEASPAPLLPWKQCPGCWCLETCPPSGRAVPELPWSGPHPLGWATPSSGKAGGGCLADTEDSPGLGSTGRQGHNQARRPCPVHVSVLAFPPGQQPQAAPWAGGQGGGAVGEGLEPWLCSALQLGSGSAAALFLAASMNVALYAGIAGGAVAALIIIGILVYCCCCREKDEDKETRP